MRRMAAIPLVGIMSGVATGLVLLAAAGLVAAMFAVIRLTADDTDKHKEIRDFVNALFGMGRPSEGRSDEPAAPAKRDVPEAERFSEPCPACGETVTHEHAECPSCGLRLQ